MTFEFKTRKPLTSQDAMLDHAKETFSHARQIVDGGMPVAREYARAWLEEYRPNYWAHWNDPETGNAIIARQKVEDFARDAFACAKKIVARGKAYYVTKNATGHKVTMTATLIADASAGACGFQPMF